MKKDNSKIKLLCISDDTEVFELYKDILGGKSILSIEYLFIDEISSTFANQDILIIDISKRKYLNALNKLKLSTNTRVFLISALDEKNQILKKIFYNNQFTHLSKPIDLDNFFKILNFNIVQIERISFVSNKEKILIDLIDKAPFKMAVYDLLGKLVYANEDYLEVNNIKYLNNSILFDELLYYPISFKEVLNQLKVLRVFTYEKDIINSCFKSHFYYIQNKDFVVHISIDITSDKQRLLDLQKTALFFEKSTEAVVITDKDAHILMANKAFSKITGFSKNEILGKKTNILNSGIHEKEFYENLWENLKYHGKWQGEIWNRRKNGEVYPEWLSITEIKNDETNEINYMALLTDVSSIREADKKLHFYAKHDHLTGLLNRTQFENMLNHTIDKCARNRNKFALMFIDLDHFKDINDTYGHDVGDVMLKTIARRLKQSLRKEDVISRIGGDEFNVIIENIKEPSDAIAIASKISENIKKDINIEDLTFYASLSIGISIYPEHGLDSTTLIKNADSAMYEVKKNGRDGFLLYNLGFTQELIKKVSMQNKLKNTIKNENFMLYYQPVICLKTQKIIGAEALIRWIEDGKFIPPDEFIPIAESHGMISEVGEFVMKKSFSDLPMILKHTNKDFKLAINVSSREFFEDDYIDKLIEKINNYGVSPENIELEITETYIMKNYDIAIEKIKLLKNQGFSFAIDDFGTGYSSLNYLKKFPMNKLKIDRSFVSDILEDKDDRLIVETIVNMAKIFNFDVQAEGVECEEHTTILRRMGCDFAQGYYYSKPIPLEEFINLIRKNNGN